MKKRILAPILVIFLATFSSAIIINEFTTDPQSDWDRNGNISTSRDEFIELFNQANETIDLTNWVLIINDSTPSTQILSGTLAPGRYKIILDPAGTINNAGQILLFDNTNQIVDSVTYGDWEDSNISDNAPDGNANNYLDECLARIPNAQDTDLDSADWQKTRCTFRTENGVTPPNQQDMNVTITGTIVFEILPRNLEFGFVQPGSQNNPALNGPITFDITGSTADAQIEITEVLGFPFDVGLKIDDSPALGKIWQILQTDPIQTATPYLDIPEDAPAGNNRGIIVYTVTSLPPE